MQMHKYIFHYLYVLFDSLRGGDQTPYFAEYKCTNPCVTASADSFYLTTINTPSVSHQRVIQRIKVHENDRSRRLKEEARKEEMKLCDREYQRTINYE